MMVQNQAPRTACVPGLSPVAFPCLIKSRNKRIVTGAMHTGACVAERNKSRIDALFQILG